MMKNNFLRLAIAVLVLIFASVGNNYAQKREIPKRWKEVKVCGLSFLVPKELKQDKRFLPIDSCVAAFKGKNIGLGIDFGAYTATLEDSPNYQNSTTETLEIDGKKATLSTSSYIGRLYVLISESEYGKYALGMTISGKNKNDLETAKQIFQSIRFLNEKK